MIVEYLVIGLMLVVPFLLLLFPEASTPRVSWPRALQRPGQYRGMPFTAQWAHTVLCLRA